MPGYKPPTVALHEYCCEHNLLGSVSEHQLPAMPHRITIHTQTGSSVAEGSGWSEEAAAISALRQLHA